jgi:glycosyltransferase involved in cell wall biosynthesis
MKILYIVPFVPWEIRVRSLNLIPRLARQHEIHLVCVSDEAPSRERQEWMGRHCESVVHVRHSAWKALGQAALAIPTGAPMRMAYCRSREAQEAVRRGFEQVGPDVVYAERWRALNFLPDKLGAPLVSDPTDSMTLYNRQLMKSGAPWERLVGAMEYRKFQRVEGELARRADVTVFCSQVDLQCVKEQAPDARYEIVPNGVDCEKYFFKEEHEEEEGRIVFAGSFRYRPNCSAAKHFLEEIFPKVRKRVPAAKFTAVGNGATSALAAYHGRDGVECIDFVPDLRPYLAKASVAVAPLQVGSGVSNKVGEGFAAGTAVVATPLACGDLPVKDGEHLFIASEATKFADKVATLLEDEEGRREMAKRARRFVEEGYDWEIVVKKMERVLESAGVANTDKQDMAAAIA